MIHFLRRAAALIASDPNVFTLSLHGRNNFPFSKQQSSLDIAFPGQTTDDEYLEALSSALPHVFDFNPGVILYQSGVDALATGRLALIPRKKSTPTPPPESRKLS